MTPSLVKECYDRQYTIAAFLLSNILVEVSAINTAVLVLIFNFYMDGEKLQTFQYDKSFIWIKLINLQ